MPHRDDVLRRDPAAVAPALTDAERDETVRGIEEWQLKSGMIPWVPDGHADPWNHVEAAMALSVGGRFSAADRAYQWLADIQRADGAWCQYYLADRVEQDKLDANVCAYVATGVLHHWRITGDRGFLDTMWPVVDAAIGFVLGLQTERGEIIWARHGDGTPWAFALLTGSSSIFHSLRSALTLAEVVGCERPGWRRAADRLANTIRHHEHDAFSPKRRWAMDWYYPVLSGAVTGEAARQRLAARRDAFVMDGHGVRCVSDRPWITTAETCECAMAHLAAGEADVARALFDWIGSLRTDEGRYWTGVVLPQGDYFPTAERSTYSSAAVVLAADAITRWSAAADIFTLPHPADQANDREP